MQKYKERMITKKHALLYKPYNDQINQVLYLGATSKAYVELSCNDIYINQALLDEMQIALNRTKKDLKEMEKEWWKND